MLFLLIHTYGKWNKRKENKITERKWNKYKYVKRCLRQHITSEKIRYTMSKRDESYAHGNVLILLNRLLCAYLRGLITSWAAAMFSLMKGRKLDSLKCKFFLYIYLVFQRFFVCLFAKFTFFSFFSLLLYNLHAFHVPLHPSAERSMFANAKCSFVEEIGEKSNLMILPNLSNFSLWIVIKPIKCLNHAIEIYLDNVQNAKKTVFFYRSITINVLQNCHNENHMKVYGLNWF